MTAATISEGDLLRLCAEVADGDKLAWLAERAIDPKATLAMADHARAAVVGMYVGYAVDGLVGWFFQVGWEACEQFRNGGKP